jgi:hypothetical protein
MSLALEARSGVVYRVTIPNRETLAVKKMQRSSDEYSALKLINNDVDNALIYSRPFGNPLPLKYGENFFIFFFEW